MGKKSRQQDIIDAARVRFAHYGFNKTTMAEIAGDCQMSAANLYRYFTGKKEILAQIAHDFFMEVEADIQVSIACKHFSVTEKIRSVVLISLNNSFERHSKAPKINEAIEFICTERADLIMDHRRNKKKILIFLLEGGVQSGVLIPHDTAMRAEAIINGTALVHPIFLGMFDIDYLRESLTHVVDMMIEGLLAAHKM